MKRLLLRVLPIYGLLSCCALLLVSCEKDEHGRLEDFIATVNGKYMERTDLHGLKIMNGEWLEMDELPDGVPFGSLPVL